MIKSRLQQGITCHQCTVNSLCISKDLEPEDIDQLNPLIAKVRCLSKKEHAFHCDDEQQNLYAVYRGTCKEYRVDELGNEIVTNFYFPGDVIGIESVASRRHMFSVIALDDVDLCVIPIEEFLNTMQENPRILKRFFTITSLKMQNDQSTRMSSTAINRVCDFILNIVLRMQERNMQNNEIVFPISQLDISNFVGVAYETVNRIIRKLRRQKIIKIKHKKLTILNFSKLEALSRLNNGIAF